MNNKNAKRLNESLKVKEIKQAISQKNKGRTKVIQKWNKIKK